MKTYRIFKHPAGQIEAVKQGWSWPALFFTFIWAFFKRLWVVGAVVLGLAFLVSILLEYVASPATANLLSNFIGLIVSCFFGLRGNIWREENLTTRGFEHVDTIQARTPDEAIASYLKRGQQPADPLPTDEPPPAG